MVTKKGWGYPGLETSLEIEKSRRKKGVCDAALVEAAVIGEGGFQQRRLDNGIFENVKYGSDSLCHRQIGMVYLEIFDWTTI